MKPRYGKDGARQKREREGTTKRIKRTAGSEKEGEEAMRRPINASYILCLDRPTLEIFN